MRTLNRFFLLSLGVVVLGTRAATVVYSPEATTYVHVNEKGSLHNGLIADSYREGVVRLDVSGMANVTGAVLRLNVSQHNNDDRIPVILRQMHDVDWLESEATYNTLAHEFPNGYTAITAQNDPSVVWYCLRAPASGQWAEFDITAAVKREAGRTGKLAFVVSSMSNRGEHNTPTTFVANSSTNVALRPQFVASWEEGTSCGAQS